jgi:hypothetical protein
MTDAPTLHAGRWRLIGARVLTVVAVVLVVVSIIANYVKREALDRNEFRRTARELVADPVIRSQVAATLADDFFTNVDIASSLRKQLPPTLQPLAGPIAGALRSGGQPAAEQLLARPRVQALFVHAAAVAQGQLITVLNGGSDVLRTTNGDVVLDLRPLVVNLGNRFDFVAKLSSQIPQNAAQVTILHSDQLQAAQDGTRLLRFIADWIWALALVAAAVAVWLARGRRHVELRALGIGLVVAGLLVLISRTLIGRYLVSHLVASDSVRPAVNHAYAIVTELLKGAGWTAVIVGVVALASIWIGGPGSRATRARRALAPYLRRAEIAYSAVVIAYLLLLWWRPTPQLGFARDVIVFFVLAIVGLEVLRRQAAREFPDVEAPDLGAAIHGLLSRRPQRVAGDPGTELERLARLHQAGSLDDDEFAQAKSLVLGPR